MNDGEHDMHLYMEPEGACFLLPPGKEVLVKIYKINSMGMMQRIKDGKIAVSMWIEQDGVDVLYEGRDIWDWITEEN